MVDAGLVLEGGAVRGLFTAGALDYMMKKRLLFRYVAGVSAGSCNAVDYVSGQMGRTRDCFIPKDGANKYFSIANLLRGRDLYDMEKVFVDFPGEIYPFDFKSFFASPIECEIVVTNCLTGRAEYMENKRERAALMELCRASSSMPLVSSMVRINGVPYLDGGLADSVPIKRSMEKGNEKNFIILTRNAGYRKVDSGRLNPVYQHRYAEYPELVKTIKSRAEHYNACMDFIEKQERDGKVFVIRPEIKCISRTESKRDRLVAFYRNGIEVMKKRMPLLVDYLKQ